MDDTDVATVANVRPIYALLAGIGMRTTKTVWPMPCPEGSRNFSSSETLEDPHYLAFVLELARDGFEIGYHGATMESSERARTVAALERFERHFGGPPRVYASHSYNRENLYWGAARLDDPLLGAFYARTNGQPHDWYQGHRPDSPYWWGDLAARLDYVRNLTFDEINLRRINPSMPYRDPRRPLGAWWFSASDAEDVGEFNRLIGEAAQDRLEAEGGVCIVATHLGKGFTAGGVVVPETERLLRRLAARNGWFVPVATLLDHLRTDRAGDGSLPAGEWRRMQWRWARDLLGRRLRWRWAAR